MSVLCHVLRVSRSGFYAWVQRGESKRSRENRSLLKEIQAAHRVSRSNYGTDPTFMETLAWSESTKIEEVLFLVNSLESQGWLSPDGQAIGSLRYSITVEGYSYLAEIDHAVTDSAQAFVAMWFGKSMDEVWRKGLLVNSKVRGGCHPTAKR